MSSPTQALQPWNTFHLAAKARRISVVNSVELLCESWQSSWQKNEPVLLLGEGSNVLFLQDFAGQVIINRIKGIDIRENGDAWLIHAGAGENWHQLVELTLEKGIAGLENLAMIPGCVGSAPIQNIGAYGVELDQVCDYVDVVHLPEGKQQRLLASECKFGYRDSIFKQQYRHEYAIVSVGLRLKKAWSPVLTYGDLTRLNASVTAREVFDAVCHMRSSKLPNPAVTGNAGSFFKNPLITARQARELQAVWPSMPGYPQLTGQVKLAAGWLIDQCQLKGFRSGGAAVHQQQALVLINAGNATGQDVVALAREVRKRVGAKFNVWLEPEVRFIGTESELDAVEVIA